MGHAARLDRCQGTVRLDALDKAVDKTGDIKSIVLVKGEIVETRGQGGDQRANLGCLLVNLTRAGIQNKEFPLTVEFDGSRCFKATGFKPHLAGVDIETDNFAGEPAGPIEPTVGAPVHAIQATIRT